MTTGNGWLSVLEFGNELLNTVQYLTDWLLTDITIPIMGPGTDTSWVVVGTVTMSIMQFLFGSGLITLLGFKFVKWIVDIVL